MTKYEKSDFPFLVQTPYGRAVVLRTRTIKADGRDDDDDDEGHEGHERIMKELQLISPDQQQQQQQQQQQPLLYSTSNFPSVIPQIGDDVICANFGRGRVVAIRHDTHTHDTHTHENDASPPPPPTTTMIQVELSYWKLAGRSKVMGWFALSSDNTNTNTNNIRVVQRKSLHEMTLAWEKVQYAQELKQVASQRFASKQFEEALEFYSQAVDAVRFVQHDANSTNEVRADLVVVMITCCNNAALCCFQLLTSTTTTTTTTTKDSPHKDSTGAVQQQQQQHQNNNNYNQNKNQCDRGIQYAKNALVMIDALYAKKGLKIHSILTCPQTGITTDSKLFGEWKVKSLFLLGRFCVHQRQWEEAQQRLKQALAVIAQYTSEEEESSSKLTTPQSKKALGSQDRQIRKLLMTIIQKRKAEKKKEKQRAMAMFGGGGSGSGTSTTSANTTNKTNDSKKNGDEKSPITPKQSTMNGSNNSRSTTTSTPSTTPKQQQQPSSAMKNSLKKKLGMNTTTSPSPSRRVSFSDMDEVTEFDSSGTKGINFINTFHVDNDNNNNNNNNNRGDDDDDIDNDKEDEPAAWYEEHLEAMIITGIMVVIGATAMALMRSTSRSK